MAHPWLTFVILVMLVNSPIFCVRVYTNNAYKGEE